MQQRCPATFKPQALLLHTTYMYFCIYASLTTNPPGFSNYPTATCCAVHGTQNVNDAINSVVPS